MNTELAKLNATQTMSSLEIAKLTEKRHSTVLDDIRRILAEVGIGEQQFLSTYMDKSNREQPCYELPRRECDLVIAGYSAKYRLLIIDRWQELELRLRTPQTFIEAMQLATQVLIENEALKTTISTIEGQRDNLQIELDQSMEWLSIKKVADYNKIPWKHIQWMPLKQHGIESCHTPRKIFDANFPNGVNTYHRASWAAVYPKLVLPGEEI